MMKMKTKLMLITVVLAVSSLRPGMGVEEEEAPKPCCFPLSFQAIVVDSRSAATGQTRLFELHRDWERRVQVQRIMTFSHTDKVMVPRVTVILDFKHAVQHIVTEPGHCETRPLDYAMLEPCMPDDASFLGETYLGFGEDKTRFQTWSFKRNDDGRNISMIVSVTSQHCVPVMESISGTLGHATVDTLVTFTTFKEVQDPSIFETPAICMPSM